MKRLLALAFVLTALPAFAQTSGVIPKDTAPRYASLPTCTPGLLGTEAILIGTGRKVCTSDGWADVGGSGGGAGTPAGSGTEVQIRKADGTDFDVVTGSSYAVNVLNLGSGNALAIPMPNPTTPAVTGGTDGTLAAATYNVKIGAVDVDGNETALSSQVNFTIAGPDDGTGSGAVSVDPISGATYRVWVKLSTDPAFVSYFPSATNEFTVATLSGRTTATPPVANTALWVNLPGALPGVATFGGANRTANFIGGNVLVGPGALQGPSGVASWPANNLWASHQDATNFGLMVDSNWTYGFTYFGIGESVFGGEMDFARTRSVDGIVPAAVASGDFLWINVGFADDGDGIDAVHPPIAAGFRVNGTVANGSVPTEFVVLLNPTGVNVASESDMLFRVTPQGTRFAMQTPANASAACTKDTFAFDTDFLYVCTATNTWKRVAIATWP